MSRETTLQAIQRLDPDSLWLDRKAAFLMGFGLIRLALTNKYVRVRRVKSE